MKSFVYLGLAIFFEVFGSTMLKLSKGLTVLTPSIGVAIGFLVSFAFFGFALKKLELSTAYAIWSGLGTAATAGVGVLLFQEALGFLKIIALLFIIVGVYILNKSKNTLEKRQTKDMLL